MNYVQKNQQTIILIVLGVVLLTAALIWGFRKQEVKQEDITATVHPMSLNVGEVMTFEDQTKFGKTRKWIITDGFQTEAAKGQHIFKKPGYYQVALIIDDKFTKTFPVLVSSRNQPAAVMPDEQMPTAIDAPVQAMQLENVMFRAVNDNAQMFTWKFGETGNIDSKEKVATYAFKNPGTYTVQLFTDVDSAPITHTIKILAAYPTMPAEKPKPTAAPAPTGPTEAEVYSRINDDFRYHLQQIANGVDFNKHYNYLVKTYLCGKDNVSVIVNEKNTTFYYYCTSLQFDKNNLIQEVKTTVDTGQNCVTKVEVKQTKQ